MIRRPAQFARRVLGSCLGGVRSGARGSGQEAELAVFGKHPAWDDFRQEYLPSGCSSVDRLRSLYQQLFEGGIEANIKQGAWPDGRPVFGHSVMVRRRAQWFLVRMWPSSDVDGRREYPLVVAATGSGVLDTSGVTRCLAGIAAVGRAVFAVTDPDAVRPVAEQVWGAFRNAIHPEAGDASDGSEVSSELPDDVDSEQFTRFLYRLNVGIGAAAGRNRLTDLSEKECGRIKGSTRLRVPRGATDAAVAVARWDRLLQPFLGGLERWIIVPDSGPWADVIAGKADTDAFKCLGLTLSDSVRDTDVPYRIEQSFRDEVLESGRQVGRVLPPGDPVAAGPEGQE